ncbi:MAG: sugar transferase [Candidatus Gorgyraea atricola]|nr:sugar transferase [Candidatus Gorgyraea atricola]
MLKEKDQLFRKLLILSDVATICVSFFIAYALRQNIEVLGELYSPSKYLNILALVLFSWMFALRSTGLYESLRRENLFGITSRIIKSAFFVMVISIGAIFIFKMEFVSRTFILSLLLVTSLFLIFERWIVISSLRFFRKKGYNFRNILVVGTGPRAKNFIELVHRHDEWGLRIIGIIDAEKKMLGKTVAGEKVIGLLKDIPKILIENVVDEAMFVIPRKWIPIIEESLLACELQGVKTNLAADFFNMKISSWSSGEVGGVPTLGFQTTVGEEWQLLVKRLSDILLSLAGMAITLPILIGVGIAIKIFSRGPAIFKQIRSGLNGRKFVMYKFRTMVDGAENGIDALRANNEMAGPVFKMRKDPRVTRFGEFLRRSSLDELPQLFNVLKGEMSIVGPRPPIPREVEKYQIWQRRRLSMKPGLTCLWQINGRNNVDFDEWMKLDLEYIDNWSLRLDLKILLKTVPAVIFSVGAR